MTRRKNAKDVADTKGGKADECQSVSSVSSIASSRPKRKAAERSPNFRYGKVVVDELSSSSGRQSSDEVDTKRKKRVTRHSGEFDDFKASHEVNNVGKADESTKANSKKSKDIESPVAHSPAKGQVELDSPRTELKKRGRPKKDATKSAEAEGTKNNESRDSNVNVTPVNIIEGGRTRRSVNTEFRSPSPENGGSVVSRNGKNKLNIEGSAAFSTDTNGTCKFCSDEPFCEDLVYHCAFYHSLLVSRDRPEGVRDSAALDKVLEIAGRLSCSKCKRLFYRSGRGLLIHEGSCDGREHASPSLTGSPSLTNNMSELIDGHTYSELETLYADKGFLRCSRCNVDYRSPISYFVKHVQTCTGEVKSPSRLSKQKTNDSSAEDEALFITEFPPPRPGPCNLCPEGLPPCADVYRHYAMAHCALYLAEPPGFRRDATALDAVLRLTGKLACQYCNREFGKSGYGLLIHESRCFRNPKVCEGLSSGTLDSSQVEENPVLIDGRTMSELEDSKTRFGFLKCSRCQNEYRSPVAYFIKHAKSCGKTSGDSDDEAEKRDSVIPSKAVSGNCVFCPVNKPPVDDMFRHYAYEHCIFFTEKEPGWSRSPEDLDVVLKLTKKLVCQFCRHAGWKSGGALIRHENRCSSRAAPPHVPPANQQVLSSNGNNVCCNENNAAIDLNESDLEIMKQRDGFLTCPRCKVDFRSPVLYFMKHIQACTGQSKKKLASSLDMLVEGKNCGAGPFQCGLCTMAPSFSDAVQLQDHFMRKHVALYSPDVPEGIRTLKAREAILKKIGSLVCPKCKASYRLGPSFMYHEKVCTKPEDTDAVDVAYILAKTIKKSVKCTICPDDTLLEPTAVQSHFMETHCAIFDPDLNAPIEKKEVLEYIMQKLGHIRCDKCGNQYRSPLWYFKRHRETCGVEPPQVESSSSESSEEEDISKKKTRRAASKAAKLISRLVERTAGDSEGESKAEKRDRTFEETSKSSSDEDTSTGEESGTESSGAEEESSRSPRKSVGSSKQSIQGSAFRSKLICVKTLRNVKLKKAVQDYTNSFRERFDNGNKPAALPSRLATLTPEFSSWTLVENAEHFLPPSTDPVLFRFESDPAESFQNMTGFTGTMSSAHNEAAFYVGGRVFALDSAPLRQDVKNDSAFFAVSAASCQDPDTRISTLQPSAVQLWQIGLEERHPTVPKLLCSLAVDAGPVLALQFCPLAPEQNNSIGLLAIGGNGLNLLSIVALPSLREIATSGETRPVYWPFTSLQLQISGDASDRAPSTDISSDSTICLRRVTCMDWSIDATTLVAALSDATVAVWNFESKSPLFSMGSPTSLLAARVFRAHSQPLVSVRVTPLTRNAIITLSVDGALSLFSTKTGQLLNSLMSPYSTQLTLMAGNAIPILVNNPWFVYRRVGNLPRQVAESTPSKDGASKCAPVISSLSAVDLFGDSPASDTWPFRPIPYGGSISCISTIKPMLPSCSSNSKPKIAFGFVTGTISGNVTLFSTTPFLLRIRARAVDFIEDSEKNVATSHLVNSNDQAIEFCSGQIPTEKESTDPLAQIVTPPTKNCVTMVNALQIEDTVDSQTAGPRVLIASALACGLIRISLTNCASTVLFCEKKRAVYGRRPKRTPKLLNAFD